MSAPETHFLTPQRSAASAIDHSRDLLEGEPLLLEVLDAMPNGVVILDPNRQIVHHNRSFGDTVAEHNPVLGLRPGEVLNCTHAWDNPAGCGTSVHCATCGAAKAIQSAQQGTMKMAECLLSVGNGAEVSALELRVWATPLTLQDEHFTIFAVTDISGEKRRQALERIFFHDIRNSAGAISGVAQLLEMADEEDLSEIHSYGELLTRASTQLLDEIHSQRQLLAAESGELAVTLDVIDTIAFLNELAQRYRTHDVAAGRHVTVAATCEVHRVTTDPALLNRVIGNMVKNALEASRRGETVTISCEEIADSVRFWVHNPGFIPRNAQLQLFKRAFSTKGDGRGLGTFSMKLLTEKYLGGSIDFISTRAGGTTFMVTLPR